jgi:hypothetical protein
MDLTGAGIVESNAPGDAVSAWEPEGRYLFKDLDNLLVDAAENTLIAVPKLGGSIYKQDLNTGVTEYVGFSTPASTDIVLNLSISPDGSLIYILYKTTSSVSEVVAVFIEVISGDVKYEKAEAAPEWASFDSYMYGDFTDGICWGSGSSAVSYICAVTVNRIDTSSWVNSEIFNSQSDYQSSWFPGPGEATVLSGGGLQSVLNVSGDTYITGTKAARIGVYQAIRYDSYIVKVDSLGVIVNHSHTYPASSYLTSAGFAWLRYNQSRDEILYFSNRGNNVLGRDLSLSAWNAISSDIVQYNPRTIKTTDTHLITRSLSSAPFWNYRLLTDYSLDKSLPALPDRGEGIAVATDYTIVQQNNGVALFDATDTLIEQQNPNVTKGDTYIYQDHVYEALQDNNDRPDLGVLNLNAEGQPDPTWLDLGFINPLRMFDNKLDSLTTGPSPLVINITPGMLVNGIALFNVNASTVQITYTDPTDGLVYDTGAISMLDNSGVQDWYSFFFDPYLVKADLARVDLPAYIDGTVQITLDGAGADVAIGEVVLGTIYKIGDAQYGSSAGIIDFSRKEADQFGNFEIVPRRFSKRAEFDAVIPPAYGGSVQRTLARLRATPVVWIGSVDLEETIVYGYFREFDILLSNPAFFNVTITVEGL